MNMNKIYVAFCDETFSMLSFEPLEDIYDDCVVYEVEYKNCMILNILYRNDNETNFVKWMENNNISYSSKYYGM